MHTETRRRRGGGGRKEEKGGGSHEAEEKMELFFPLWMQNIFGHSSTSSQEFSSMRDAE